MTVGATVAVITGGVTANVAVAVGTRVAVGVMSTDGVNTVVEMAVKVAARVGTLAVGVSVGGGFGALMDFPAGITSAFNKQLACCNWATVVPVRAAMAESVSPSRTP